MVSNRTRGNSSVGNKLVNLDSRVASTEKRSAVNVGENAVNSTQLATDSVGSDAIIPEAVGEDSVAPAAVGSNHFTTISRVQSDFNLQLETGPGGNLILKGDQYPTAATGAPLLIDANNKVISGADAATVIAALQGLVSSPGDVKMVAGTVPSNGWLLCNGSAISRTTYANLFAAIGTSYGAGDGTTTFNLPNLQGKIPVGRDTAQTEFDTVGETGGEKTHILSAAEMPSHTHTQNAHNHGITDPTHGHFVNDPSHGHSVWDNGHSHNFNHGHSIWDNGHAHGSSTLSGFMTYQTTNATRQRVATVSGTTVGTYVIGTRQAGNSQYIDDIGYGNTSNGGGNHGVNDFNGNTGGGGGNHGVNGNTTGITLNGSSTGITINNATPTNNNTGGGTAHNNLQPYVVMNYVIRY